MRWATLRERLSKAAPKNSGADADAQEVDEEETDVGPSDHAFDLPTHTET